MGNALARSRENNAKSLNKTPLPTSVITDNSSNSSNSLKTRRAMYSTSGIKHKHKHKHKPKAFTQTDNYNYNYNYNSNSKNVLETHSSVTRTLLPKETSHFLPIERCK